VSLDDDIRQANARKERAKNIMEDRLQERNQIAHLKDSNIKALRQKYWNAHQKYLLAKAAFDTAHTRLARLEAAKKHQDQRRGQ
jgi:hypothetical protein